MSGITANSVEFQPTAYTVIEAGIYYVLMEQYINLPSAADIYIRINRNGAQVVADRQQFNSTHFIQTLKCGKVIALNKGDTLTFKICNSSSTQLVTNNDGAISFAQVVRLK